MNLKARHIASEEIGEILNWNDHELLIRLPDGKEVWFPLWDLEAVEIISLERRDFWSQIEWFNDTFGVESNNAPTWLGYKRLNNFLDILAEEVKEGELILNHKDSPAASNINDLLTELSDWLCDIIIYCASEMRRWGLPTQEVLNIIMQSQATKMGADGKPIYDERGKVMKGPFYTPPEPQIRQLLKSLINQRPQSNVDTTEEMDT